MRPSLRRYLLAQRISAATTAATMSKMVNSGHPKPNGIRSTPCFLWDGRFPATERFVPNVSAGGASPFHHRRTDTNTNSVAWANPSALLQRLAYPTPGDCQAQTRRRRAPSVPLAVIPTLMTVIPAQAEPRRHYRAPWTGRSPVSPNLHAPRHSRESGNLPPCRLYAKAPICDNRPLRERPLLALRWIPTAQAARRDAGGKRTRRARGGHSILHHFRSKLPHFRPK